MTNDKPTATIQIHEISILIQSRHSDTITLYCNLPMVTWPYEGEEGLVIRCAAGRGKEYVEKHFPGIPVKIITF